MRPIHNALDLIEALSIAQPAGVTELAGITGLPRSTAQRVLTSLHETGWIEYADVGRRDWRLSLRALIVSGRATQAQSLLRNVAVPVMEDLRRNTEETIHLMVRQANHVVLIERLDGLLRVDDFRPLGSDAALSTVATGRAILARLSEDEREAAFVANAAERKYSDELLAECRLRVSIAQEAGFAITQGSNRLNVGAVGAAILDGDNMPIAAISASGPLSRMDKARCEKFGPLVADAAHRIGMGMQWSRASNGR
jgi:DNA-binding IclR family transcriptional regulator